MLTVFLGQFLVSVIECRPLHGAIWFFWFLSFVLVMVAEIQIAKLDQAADCIYHKKTDESDPVCTSPWDWAMIASYVVTFISFIEM